MSGLKSLLMILLICAASFMLTSAAKVKKGSMICPKNEIYSCGSSCQTECATLGQPCTIINIKCQDSCYCIDGYARNSRGKCIPIEYC